MVESGKVYRKISHVCESDDGRTELGDGRVEMPSTENSTRRLLLESTSRVEESEI